MATDYSSEQHVGIYIQYSSHVVNVFFYDIPTIDLSVVDINEDHTWSCLSPEVKQYSRKSIDMYISP